LREREIYPGIKPVKQAAYSGAARILASSRTSLNLAIQVAKPWPSDADSQFNDNAESSQ
jgi:hypothetical protein